MFEKIRAFIEEKNLIETGEGVILGLSGGADSVCLLFSLLGIFDKNIRLLAIHVNHGLRGEEAKRDEDFVKRLCERMQVELLVKRVNIPETAKKEKLSLEEAGRLVRYRIFREELQKRGFQKIAVAHNKEDLAETFLINLARGSALMGLTGIKEKSGDIVRPLLRTGRREILQILRDLGEGFVTDSTNLSGDYTRNVVRNEIIPIFEKKVNTEVVEHITNSAAFLREADAFIKSEAMKTLPLYVIRSSEGLFIRQELTFLHGILIKEILYEAISEAALAKKDITALHIEAVLALFEKQVGKRVELPYFVDAVRTYEGLLLKKREDGEEKKGKLPVFQKEVLEIEAIESIRIEGYNIELTLQNGEVKKLHQNGCERWFDYDRITEKVKLRTWNEGDYLVISKGGNRKKLKRFFIDEKVPKEERDKIPLICAGSEILWVIGRRTGEGARIGLDTRRLLNIRITEEE